MVYISASIYFVLFHLLKRLRCCDALNYEDAVGNDITLHYTKLGTKLQFTAVGRPVRSNSQIRVAKEQRF
jgi:hypothetical protein